MFLSSWIFNIIIITIILTVGVISFDFTNLIKCRCKCIKEVNELITDQKLDDDLEGEKRCMAFKL